MIMDITIEISETSVAHVDKQVIEQPLKTQLSLCIREV